MRSVFAMGAAAALALLTPVTAWKETVPRPAPTVASSPPVDIRSGPAPPLREESRPATREPPAAAATRDPIQAALQSGDVQVRTQAYRLLRHCALVLSQGTARPLVSPPA